MKTISNFALWLPKLKIVFIKENQSSPFVFLTMCKCFRHIKPEDFTNLLTSSIEEIFPFPLKPFDFKTKLKKTVLSVR